VSPERLPGRLSRRALGAGVLATPAALAVLTTAGCDSGGVDLPSLPGLPAGNEDQDQPDLDQVQDALRGEQAMLATVQQVRRRQRSMRKALGATAAVHQAHVDLLQSAVEGASSASPAPPPSSAHKLSSDPAKAVAGLVTLERKLSAAHAGTALSSRSGVLARVVAAMSAAAAQQAVVIGRLSTPAKEPSR